MSYKCDICKEEYNFKDEIVFLNGINQVQSIEDGGSGDIDSIVCNCCHEEIENIHSLIRNKDIIKITLNPEVLRDMLDGDENIVISLIKDIEGTYYDEFILDGKACNNSHVIYYKDILTNIISKAWLLFEK